MDRGKVESRAGGHLCICGNGGTENVPLAKRKRRIKKDMASENVAKEVSFINLPHYSNAIMFLEVM